MTAAPASFRLRFAGISLVALAACGAAAGALNERFEEEVVSKTPTERAIAASNTFFRCKAGDEADVFMCYACDVTVHDDEDGITAYASDYEHKLKPWEPGEEPRVTVTGELDGKKFTNESRTAEAAHAAFAEAKAWCKARGKGKFHPLKDEIDTHFSGRVE
ncbi:MAG: hypothetical protein KDA53_04155 [Hyphomonas sp.]|nr:hypothetical protein [Hyphomonas sp.]